MDTDNIDVARSPPSCSSERPGPANDGSLSPPNTSQAPLSIHSSIMNLLNTTLSPDQLQSNFSKLDFLKKSSFYIMIAVKNDLQPIRQDYITNSTIWRHIDRSRFEHVKSDSINQVKLQPMLLTMLYDELTTGQKELKDILARGMVSLELGEANIQQKILRLQQTAEDFNKTIVPGKLGVKHQMIPDLISNRLPNLELSLNAKKPVMFKRPQSRAFSRSVVLHWYIPDEEQGTPDDKFEIRFKLLNPENETDALAFGCRTCSGLAYRFSRLIPNCSYTFSVQRMDNASLIYSVWKDIITLSTSTQSTRVGL